MQTNICPHLDIYKIQTSRYGDVFSSLTRYDFKFERIVSASGALLGYEILLDFAKAKCSGDIACVAQYEKAIHDTSAIEFAISKLLKAKSTLRVNRLFLNFERMHLCHRQLLAKIALLSKELFVNNIELVLEITERDVCGNCEQIRYGLSFLKSAGVSLAVDDFDIYNGDFRVAEVLSGLYDYIKVEAPITAAQRTTFNKFATLSFLKEKKIIMERIENTAMLRGLVIPFGLQGYAYGRSSQPERPDKKINTRGVFARH
ncbi:EAL domain-containing protein [Aeromonas enteropelogenes]|uniref:EAL domain-containing protein n=1 Tax=Aeromonas enteropelogenes TaxID=29489 RepID=UPI0031348BE2